MVRGAEMMSQDRFTEEYISLHGKVKRTQPGGNTFHTLFFNYLPTPVKSLERKKLLIAVVTTERYLLTRTLAIEQTWAKDLTVNSHLYFFVGEDCNISNPKLKHLPIIKIKDVRDNVYPPQKKVFAVLEHIHQRFGSKYKWFLRADDDVYVRVQELENLLDQLDWTKKVYMGHPGFGKAEDRRRLKLLPHENYCMGGPGVVLSAPALGALEVHLSRCLKAVETYNSRVGKNLGWYNEDVELGRCVSRTVGISCVPPKVSISW